MTKNGHQLLFAVLFHIGALIGLVICAMKTLSVNKLFIKLGSVKDLIKLDEK